MADNPEKTVNHYAQFALLFLIIITCLSFYTPALGFSIILVGLLPLLGIWQLIDFIVLWKINGHEKWYDSYLWAVFVFTLLVLLGYVFSNTKIVNIFTIQLVIYYSVVIASVYLFYWRKN